MRKTFVCQRREKYGKNQVEKHENYVDKCVDKLVLFVEWWKTSYGRSP